MSGRLAGKVAIVTGGNSGIGKAAVQAFAREGAKVAFFARREEPGRAVEEEVRSAGADASFVACDVTDEAAVQRAVAQVVERYGALHVLFNNAGGAPGGGLFPAESLEQWTTTLTVNLTGTYIVTRACWDHLAAAEGASVVNMSSTAAVAALSEEQRALLPGIPPAAYAASKAGIEAFTRYIASVGSPHGIRANAVRPGQINTENTTQYTPGHHVFEPYFENTQLVKGPGMPEDVANLALFLASDEARFIDGQVIDVDGGVAGKV